MTKETDEICALRRVALPTLDTRYMDSTEASEIDFGEAKWKIPWKQSYSPVDLIDSCSF